MNAKQIMTTAWTTARQAATQFGGKASEFFRGALKMAWAEAKFSIDALIKAGGKLWEKNGMRRVYFNGLERLFKEAIGLELSYYKTGNVSSARMGGNGISNCEARRQLCKVGDGSKVWFDLADNKFHGREIADDAFRAIVGQIKASI